MKYVCFKFLSFNEYPQTAYVGAYRIHPNAHTYLRGCFQGVCNTPFVTPDLQSGVIETRICNPHRPHGAFRQASSVDVADYKSAARLRWITNPA